MTDADRENDPEVPSLSEIYRDAWSDPTWRRQLIGLTLLTVVMVVALLYYAI
ncbi:hypothetical protein [Halalkalicoccus tibetensis]|uniref:Uncharacterized protein n=1 Tax=Halalkalicoccus tibetensis TaxID=175632 RepID=A0ABD5VAP3_9EURY